MLFFKIYLVFLGAEISNVVADKKIAWSENLEKTEMYEEWMNHIKLSEDLQKRVKTHHKYLWNKFKGLDINFILTSLPVSLKYEIIEYLLKEYYFSFKFN